MSGEYPRSPIVRLNGVQFGLESKKPLALTKGLIDTLTSTLTL